MAASFDEGRTSAARPASVLDMPSLVAAAGDFPVTTGEELKR
ncbi:MAG: hypothetical protein ACRD0W_03625 [Acidimicrobiales bacterium]